MKPTKAVAMYSDDVIAMVSDAKEVEAVSAILKKYNTVADTKINLDRSVCLQLDT